MVRHCFRCGESFENTLGLSTHCRHKHDNKPWIPEQALHYLYHSKELSQYEIADEFDTSQGVVATAMDKYGIETDKSMGDPTYPVSHRFTEQRGENLGTTYERVQTTHNGETQSVYIHRLVAVADGKLPVGKAFDGNAVVHHKNGCGIDNRPDNLEVMHRSDHQSMHNKERFE